MLSRFGMLACILLTIEVTTHGLAARPSPGSHSTVVLGPPVQFVEQPGRTEFSGKLVVRPWPGPTRGVAVARITPRLVRSYPEVSEFIVSVPIGSDENRYAAELLGTGDYEYVHPDWICYPQALPDDPLFPNQWHHAKIKSPQAWEIATGSTHSIICAFVDTGIDLNHPDLAGALVPGYNSASELAQDSGGDISDITGHGTGVAGAALAIGNNGIGVSGVCWQQQVMMIRATNSLDGSASESALLSGARWAAEHGARVISVSYSGVKSPSVQTTGAYIKSMGGLLCYSADNSGVDHGDFDWPDVIIVGATDLNDEKAPFSSFGQALDLYAPGINIWTTKKGGGYAAETGTSYSTPIVAGMLTLILSIDPSLTPDQAERALLFGCDELGPPGDDPFWGHGRANLQGAAQLAMVAGSPSAPYAVDDAVVTLIDQPVHVDVLVNDFDLDMDPLTIIAFDHATEAGGSIALSEGTGAGGRDELVYSPPPGSALQDAFSYTIADGTGLETSGTVTIHVEDPSTYRAPDTPTFSKPGLRTSYYLLDSSVAMLPDFGALTPYATAIVSQLAYPSTAGIFASSGLTDFVGAVFTGLVHVPEPAHYTFHLSSDDGSSLYVGDQLVVLNDGIHHKMIERSGTIALQAGWHAVRVEFFEQTGGAGLIVGLAMGAQPPVTIAPADWAHATCDADLSGDLFVGQEDLGTLLAAYGACSDDPGFVAAADFDADGCVGQGDLGALLAVYGTPCP
jgi:subtilisin family serine protease